MLYDLNSSIEGSLAGIVEDTENGHRKYQSLLLAGSHKEFPCPVFSVARSPLKEPEDFLVGQAVVFSADALLREQGDLIIGKRALVLGYGKIGSSIANYLRIKGAQVSIHDINPIKRVLALSHSFSVQPINEGIKNSHLIFSATGNKSISISDFDHIKNLAYVFTATSGDDEILDYDNLIKTYESKGDKTFIKVGKNRKVCLFNNGNSVNFIHGGVVGLFIKLVQAELVYAISRLSSGDKSRIEALEKVDRDAIAHAWIEVFGSSDSESDEK